MTKLSCTKVASVYTTYIGRYVTSIFLSTGEGDVYACTGTELDLEGKKKLLQLKHEGYKIVED